MRWGEAGKERSPSTEGLVVVSRGRLGFDEVERDSSATLTARFVENLLALQSLAELARVDEQFDICHQLGAWRVAVGHFDRDKILDDPRGIIGAPSMIPIALDRILHPLIECFLQLCLALCGMLFACI